MADQILSGVPRRIGTCHQQNGVGHCSDVDRGEFIVIKIGHTHHTEQRLWLGTHQNGVTICRLLQHKVCANHTRSAGFVLQHDFSAQCFFCIGRIAAHGHVGTAPCAPLDHCSHITGGIGLSHGLPTHGDRSDGQQGSAQKLSFLQGHFVSIKFHKKDSSPITRTHGFHACAELSGQCTLKGSIHISIHTDPKKYGSPIRNRSTNERIKGKR